MANQGVPEIIINKYKASKLTLLSREQKDQKIVPFLKT
jgi:hypothetical protein